MDPIEINIRKVEAERLKVEDRLCDSELPLEEIEKLFTRQCTLTGMSQYLIQIRLMREAQKKIKPATLLEMPSGSNRFEA